MAKICSVKDCEKPVKAGGYCNSHYMAKWNREHRDHVNAAKKKYYAENKLKVLERVKKYQEKNYAKVLKRKREHYAENQPRLVKERKERYYSNPEKYKEIVRKSAKKHRTKILQKKKKEFQDYRINVLTYYSKGSPKCKNCGISGIPFLNIDHIYGRKQMGHLRNMGTLKLYRYLDKEQPTGYQVLCYNCNMIKELKRKEKAHKQTPTAKKRRRQRRDTKEFVLSGYSRGKPKCVCCGFSNLDGLALDHIEGRKKMGHLREFGSDDLRMVLKKEYKKTEKWPSGLQVLCHNCNGAKRESPECPHKMKIIQN